MARAMQSRNSKLILCPFCFLDKIDSPFCLQNCFFLLAAHFAQILLSKFCQGLFIICASILCSMYIMYLQIMRLHITCFILCACMYTLNLAELLPNYLSNLRSIPYENVSQWKQMALRNFFLTVHAGGVCSNSKQLATYMYCVCFIDCYLFMV